MKSNYQLTSSCLDSDHYRNSSPALSLQNTWVTPSILLLHSCDLQAISCHVEPGIADGIAILGPYNWSLWIAKVHRTDNDRCGVQCQVLLSGHIPEAWVHWREADKGIWLHDPKHKKLNFLKHPPDVTCWSSMFTHHTLWWWCVCVHWHKCSDRSHCLSSWVQKWPTPNWVMWWL